MSGCIQEWKEGEKENRWEKRGKNRGKSAKMLPPPSPPQPDLYATVIISNLLCYSPLNEDLKNRPVPRGASDLELGTRHTRRV